MSGRAACRSGHLAVRILVNPLTVTVAIWVSFVIFDIRTLIPKRQSARMSKTTNDGLTRSDTGCFIASITHMATVGVKWLISAKSFDFYPRDAMLARVIAIATCLSVCLSVTR